MVENKLENKTIINKSLSFLLPLFQLKNYNDIVNTYLGDANDTDNDFFSNKLYILCSREAHLIEYNKHCVNSYEVNDGIMYVMQIPEKYEEDYAKFLKGQYSKFTDDAKKVICSYACRNSIKKASDTIIYSILYKTPARKKELEEKLDVKLSDDAELASIYNPEREVYGIK